MTPELEALNVKLGGIPPAVPTAQPPPVPAPAAAPVVGSDGQMELPLDAAPAAAAVSAPEPAPVPAPAVSGGMVTVSGNVVYIGKDMNRPQIGDVRVTLTKVMPEEVSIIAQISGKTFEAYTASNGGEFLELKMGAVSKAGMIASAHAKNNFWTWILRLIGVLCVIGGLKGIFGILTTLLKVVPLRMTRRGQTN